MGSGRALGVSRFSLMKTIALSGDITGNKFSVIEIHLRELSRQVMDTMRFSGQIDCGKRQILIPLQVEALHQKTRDALAKAELDLGEGAISYFGPESRQEAERAAAIIAREETANGRPTKVGAIDRDIPCG